MKLLAGFVAAAMANDWGYYYDDDAYYGKSQASQTYGTSNLSSGRSEGIMGNGRVCWHCSERNYGDCLANAPTIGDALRHGAAYCVGEDYFCFISERRIIKHDGNDFNHEVDQPWSSGTIPDHAEQNDAFGSSNNIVLTHIKVEMGCQQPQACLRQQNMNYKIDMGNTFYGSTVPLTPYVPVAAFGNLVREGLCRLGLDWQDYAQGNYSGDQWRAGTWSAAAYDRRYGGPEHHYHFGKGTESVCHHCCDALREYSSASGCNYDAVSSGAGNIATGDVDGTGTLSNNVFLKRQHNWKSPVFNDANQYHGMFRNPHTNIARQVHTPNNSGTSPNGRK